MRVSRVVFIAAGAAALALAGWWYLGTGPSWSSHVTANDRQVAEALDDPFGPGAPEPVDPASVPTFDPPERLRPCCAFGMDLKAKVGSVVVPGYEQGNVLSIDELGHHGYGDGLSLEHNGLVYTCRGGFIDVAHIRDNADRTLYLAMRIARSLPAAFTVDLPEEGARRRLLVKALPAGMLERGGRWRIASAMAQWANFQLSVWHEIITFYDFETIKGYPEKVSSFTPEDLYSNVLGQRIAGGIIANRETRSREEYNQAMDAWVPEALRRLGAVSTEDGRRAMKALDGVWWDSRQALPEWKLVLRRYTDIGPTLLPWLVTDGVPDDPSLRRMCAGKPPALAMETPEQVGGKRIDALATVELTMGRWVPEGFAGGASEGTVFTQADFPAMVTQIKREAVRDLGEGFDSPQPRAKAVPPSPSAASR